MVIAAEHAHLDTTAFLNWVEIEPELNIVRQAIARTLQERKELPREIVELTSTLDTLQPESEYQIKQFRSHERRFNSRAKELEALESGLVSYYTDERTQEYLNCLDEAQLCAEKAMLLEEEVEITQIQLGELEAEELMLAQRVEYLEELRDVIVQQRDELILEETLPSVYREFVRVKSVEDGRATLQIAGQNMPRAFAIYSSGQIETSIEFLGELYLLNQSKQGRVFQ